MKIDIELLKKGDRRTLAKAITLVESQNENDRREANELLKEILPLSGKSFRLGITGTPGVGKSTFIEYFGKFLIAKGHKVAVLAVDPSSPITGGSIMGDKTRMEKLSIDENAFIRPSPSSGALGGVAHKTRESILLCEAAGFDYILIETVGVGQSEVTVAGMVDFFLVLMLPNAGDELQGIKKGILELADMIAVNKADGDLVTAATRTMAQYQGALDLLSHSDFWKPIATTCSSISGHNIESIYQNLNEFKSKSIKDNFLKTKRSQQNINWMNSLLREMIEQKLNNDPALLQLQKNLTQSVIDNQTTPLESAEKLYRSLFK